MSDVLVDVQGLVQLQKALKAAADGTDKRLRAGLKAAGSIVQKQAQANAGEHSSHIAGTIKVSVTGKAVAVQTSDGEAISYETHGKHPVWSSDRSRWNKMPLKRPFLAPALDEKGDEAAEAILNAVADFTL